MLEPPAHVFREYDIRGKADIDLGDELVREIGRAFASTLPGAAPVVAVGRDCRLSSDRLFAALTAGIREAGASVIDIGVGPTPLLYFAAHHLGTEGSMMITGSHNPPEDNGFKMMRGKGTLFGPDIQELREIIASGGGKRGGAGGIEARAIDDDYVASLRRASVLGAVPEGLKVVVDAGNGAAGPLALKAFAALGVAVDPLFCEMDGRFPAHHPDPTVEENLVDLRRRVAETGAALGIAFDGDGDRIGVIDDAGAIIWGDKLLILFARGVLAEHPGAMVLGEVKCSQTLFDAIAKAGGEPIVCKTGHSLIKKRMKDDGALLAGEMSGHIFFADRYYGFDDATYAAIRLIELVVATGKKPRELLADVPPTSVTPEIRVDCPDAIKFAVVEGVLAHYRPTHEVLDVDGARILFGDGAWGLCRASNTGPVLVLRFEARDDARRDALRREVEGVVARVRQELCG
jgi:phosphomannomutase / phosphoglucomutase